MFIRCFCLCTVLVSLPGVCIAGEIVGEIIGEPLFFFPSSDSPEEQRLATAISSGDLSAVKSAAEKVYLRDVSTYGLKDYVLVNGTAEIVRFINSLAKLEITPLQIAVISNDHKAVKRLFPRLPQRPPSAYRSDNLSPLRLAIRKKNVPMIKLLIQQNMPVNESVATMWPREKVNIVLSAAIHEGNAEIVRLLVDAGSQLEEPETYLAPVPGATYKGQPVKKLLYDLRYTAERKKLVQELDDKGLMRREKIHNANHGCPLADAVAAGRAKVVEVLLEAGANPNISIGGYPNLASGGYTYPLHMACGSGHPGIVKLLIDAGADVNQLDSEGRDPLGLGWYNGDIADMLRAAGAKLHQKKTKKRVVERLDAGPEFIPAPVPDADGNTSP